MIIILLNLIPKDTINAKVYEYQVVNSKYVLTDIGVNLDQETPTPEIASTPEVTPTPEIASTPEVTPTPEVASTPEVTPISETSPTPEVTSTPQSTYTPELTTTPLPTPSLKPTSTPMALKKIVTPNFKYSYKQLLIDIDILCDTYKSILTKEVIGKSVDGRKIIMLKLGNGNNKILLSGATHAREYISTTYIMKSVDEICFNYYNKSKYEGYDLNRLLSKCTLYIIPMLNPDGVEIVQNGINSIKNPAAKKILIKSKPINAKYKNTYQIWKANAMGVDLNRNYPLGWVKVVIPKSQSYMNYKGPKPLSEPETIAMYNLCNKMKFSSTYNFHSKGEVVFVNDYLTKSNNSVSAIIANSLSKISGFKKIWLSNNDEYGAHFADWFRGTFKKPSITIELCPLNNSELPFDDKNFDRVWKTSKKIIPEIIKLASN